MLPTTEIRRVVTKGTVIFREGEPGNCAYVIERGSVEISTQRGSERIVIARRTAGEIFGEMAIIDNRPRSATVTAASDCELVILSAEQLNERLQTLDPILRMVLTVVLDRFRDTMQRFKSETVGPTSAFDALEGSGIDPEVRVQAHSEAIERILLEQQLKDAIAQKQLFLLFQPIVSCRTGRISSFESLVRWRHPKRGLVAPDAFIAAAEQSGLICEITAHVIEQACESLADLRTTGGQVQPPLDDLSISVNVSARDFLNPQFVEHIEDCLKRHRVDPRRLTLEITESMVMQSPDTTLQILERCRGIGLSISIDDFGTGYSSLSYLHRFPFETLKIDRSFLRNMHSETNGKEVVRAMIALGHGLGLKVVAEGIEEIEQAAVVQLFGCDYLQGYLFSKPVSLEETHAMIRDWHDVHASSLDRLALTPHAEADGAPLPRAISD